MSNCVNNKFYLQKQAEGFCLTLGLTIPALYSFFSTVQFFIIYIHPSTTLDLYYTLGEYRLCFHYFVSVNNNSANILHMSASDSPPKKNAECYDMCISNLIDSCHIVLIFVCFLEYNFCPYLYDLLQAFSHAF